MSTELVNSTKDYLTNRDWGASIAVTLNMKQGKRYEDPEGKISGSFYVPLDEYKINQNFRHFTNLLNRACFGNNWRRFNKRLNVSLSHENVSRKHLHVRIQLPSKNPKTIGDLKEQEQLRFKLLSLVRACWVETKWAFGSRISFYSDEGWSGYIAKPKSKENYDLAFPWELISLPAKAS